MEKLDLLRLHPSRGKALLGLIANVVFAIFSLVLTMRGHAILGWAMIVVFILVGIPYGIQLWPNASYLELSADGFQVRLNFRDYPLTRWDQVSQFQVKRPALGRAAAVVYNSEDSEHPWLQALNRALTGGSHGLLETYGKSPENLAELLNQWREQALLREGITPSDEVS